MARFWTSDLHLGHYNVISYCSRPFKDAYHMNAELINRWNERISPEDTVYVLGDVSMGFRHIPYCIPQLNGYKILIYGNHDGKLFKGKQMGDYLCHFDEVYLHSQITLSIEGKDVVFNMSHLPYKGGGDSGYEERFTSKRLEDEGVPLLHGHCHSTPDQKFRFTKKGTWCMDVGVDGNNYYPYSEEDICKLYLATL